MEGKNRKLKKLEELLNLLNDPEIKEDPQIRENIEKSLINLNISGGDNAFSVLGNVIKKQINYYGHKPKVEITPELTPAELKTLREYVDRIVKLEIQARKYKVASPYGIRVNSKSKNITKATYAAVWKRFQDEFNLNSYKALPKASYNTAIKFLMFWEEKLLNSFLKRELFDEIEFDKAYLLRKTFGQAKKNGKTKEDLDLYCLKKFNLSLSEAKPLHIWYVYSRFARRPRGKRK